MDDYVQRENRDLPPEFQDHYINDHNYCEECNKNCGNQEEMKKHQLEL